MGVHKYFWPIIPCHRNNLEYRNHGVSGGWKVGKSKNYSSASVHQQCEIIIFMV